MRRLLVLTCVLFCLLAPTVYQAKEQDIPQGGTAFRRPARPTSAFRHFPASGGGRGAAPPRRQWRRFSSRPAGSPCPAAHVPRPLDLPERLKAYLDYHFPALRQQD